MRNKCAISSWEQLKRGDIIYKVPRFNICAAHSYGEFGRRIKDCCERALIIESNERLVNIAVDFNNNSIMSKSIKSMQKRIDPDLLFGMISLSDRARFWRAIELHYE